MEHDTRDKPVLFISDLHLDPARPSIVALFQRFLAETAPRAQALYILGDLFEAWIGDDAVPPDHPVLTALRGFADTGIPLRIMHGNRDFLLGERFAAATGAELIDDPLRVRLDGEPVLLMHGDTLCTDDLEYQRFRAMVRDTAWQREFLAMPVQERIAYAQRARTESSSHMQSVEDYITDVNQGAVEETMRRQGVLRLIHGHTHRPAVHEFHLDGRPARRIVLGDWYEQGSMLRWQDGEAQLMELPAAG